VAGNDDLNQILTPTGPQRDVVHISYIHSADLFILDNTIDINLSPYDLQL